MSLTQKVNIYNFEAGKLSLGSIVKKEAEIKDEKEKKEGGSNKVTYYEPTLNYNYAPNGKAPRVDKFKLEFPPSLSKYGISRKEKFARGEQYQILMTFLSIHGIEILRLGMEEDEYNDYRIKEVELLIKVLSEVRTFIIDSLYKYPRKLGYDPEHEEEDKQNFDKAAFTKNSKQAKSIHIPSKVEIEQGKKPSMFSEVKFYRSKDGSKTYKCNITTPMSTEEIQEELARNPKSSKRTKDVEFEDCINRSIWFVPVVNFSRLYFSQKDGIKMQPVLESMVLLDSKEPEDDANQDDTAELYSAYINPSNQITINERREEVRTPKITNEDIESLANKYANFDMEQPVFRQRKDDVPEENDPELKHYNTNN
jgi:hypothetical protein